MNIIIFTILIIILKSPYLSFYNIYNTNNNIYNINNNIFNINNNKN
jgi:hypothetical protein